MKFSELMDRLKARGVEVVACAGEAEITGVCEDSRKARPGDLFVAREGVKVSGEQFVADAVSKGAAAIILGSTTAAVVSSPPTPSARVEGRSIALAQVTNTNLACAIAAHEIAGNPTSGMKVIGITGTKGKTTVAYLLRSVLKAAGLKVGMIGTVEIDDGVAVVPADMTTPGSVELVSLFSKMRENGVTHCVMEVSSHALHQHRVAGVEFAVGVFTNLTGDHLDYHGTMEEYAAAKGMLFRGLKKDAVAVVNGDDAWVEKMVEGCRAKVVRCQLDYRGLSGEGRLLFGIHKMSSSMMTMWVWPVMEPFRTSDRALHTRLVGRHNAYNIASVYAAGYMLGVDIEEMIVALEDSMGAPGRMQRVEGNIDFQIFVHYAHTHDALENVLSALRVTMGRSSGGPSDEHAQRPSGPGLARPESVRAAEHGTRELVCAARGGDSSGPSADGPPKGGTTYGRLICVFGCGGDRDRTKRPKMGAVAERLADVVIVTSDNPRTENADAIIGEICAGFSQGVRAALQAGGGQDARVTADGARVTVEPDRRVAIQKAIGMARAGDVVLIAGKGHENYQIIGATKHHFDDVEEAEHFLRQHFQHQDTKTPRHQEK